MSNGRHPRQEGKADQVAKALVLIQTGWIVIQTISRKVSGLPITLIELNTFAHVGCAVVMYAIWWVKPQNASEPLKIVINHATAADGLCDSFVNKFNFLPVTDENREENNAQTISVTELTEPATTEPTTENNPQSSTFPRIPPNESGYEVVSQISDGPRGYSQQQIEDFSRNEGVVMLFRGQSLKVIPYSPYSVCHLSKMEVSRLRHLASLGFSSNAAYFESRVATSVTSNMKTSGNLEQVPVWR
jgi:hypothetical protein